MNLSCKETSNLADLKKQLPTLIKYQQNVEKILKIHHKNPLLGKYFQGVDTPIQDLMILRQWYKLVREEYGIGFGERVIFGTTLLSLDHALANAIAEEYSKQLNDLVKQLSDSLNGLSRTFPHLYGEFINLAVSQSPLHILNQQLQIVLTELKNILVMDNSHLKR